MIEQASYVKGLLRDITGYKRTCNERHSLGQRHFARFNVKEWCLYT